MKSGDPILETVTVLYDGECGLCAGLKQHFEKEPTWVRLEFLAFQDPTVAERFPGVEAYEPSRQLVVIDDLKNVYQGDNAWIMVLYATRRYWPLAMDLGQSGLRSLARSLCLWVSRHRKTLSHPLLLKTIHPTTTYK